MKKIIQIKNSKNELLEILEEGNLKSKTIILFVHGLLSDLHENFNYFDDLSLAFQEKFKTIRFSFSGCGNSQGKQEDWCLSKGVDDLKSVLSYIQKEDKEVYIWAHSIGVFVVSELSPKGITKTIFTSPPNPDPFITINGIKERIQKQKNGVLNEQGVSIYPRTNGDIQKLGSLFWKDLTSFKPMEKIMEFSKNTKLMIVKPKDDEIIINTTISIYEDNLPKEVIFMKLNGDHNFSEMMDRTVLINFVEDFFKYK